jgi:hypothetical protein
MPDKRFVTI